MSKTEFLEALKSRIAQLPPIEIDKTIAYYSEIIDDRIEDGMTESEAISSLDLDSIVSQIMLDTPLYTLIKAKAKKSYAWTAGKIAFVIICSPIWVPLLIAVLSVIFALAISVLAVIFSIFAVVFSLGIAGVFAVISSPFEFASSAGIGLTSLGTGFVLVGLMLLAVYPAVIICNLIAKACKKLFNKIKSLLVQKGGILS
ncbi:MAG: DUF1700 domain-containing protein [Bacillota bacterium]|nr:DUF1700 domain-containing protein [Bacillota bacterium]